MKTADEFLEELKTELFFYRRYYLDNFKLRMVFERLAGKIEQFQQASKTDENS